MFVGVAGVSRTRCLRFRGCISSSSWRRFVNVVGSIRVPTNVRCVYIGAVDDVLEVIHYLMCEGLDLFGRWAVWI